MRGNKSKGPRTLFGHPCVLVFLIVTRGKSTLPPVRLRELPSLALPSFPLEDGVREGLIIKDLMLSRISFCYVGLWLLEAPRLRSLMGPWAQCKISNDVTKSTPRNIQEQGYMGKRRKNTDIIAYLFLFPCVIKLCSTDQG